MKYLLVCSVVALLGLSVLGAPSESSSSSSASLYSDREKRSPQGGSQNCGPPPNGSPCGPPPGSPPGPPPGMSPDDMAQSEHTMPQSGSSGFVSGDMKRSRRATQVGGDGGRGRGRGGGDMRGDMGGGFGVGMGTNVGAGGQHGGGMG